MMKILTTAANRGRSIKKCASFTAGALAPALAGREADRSGLGRYVRARPYGRNPVDDHAIGGIEPRANDPEAVAQVAQQDVLRRHDVVGPTVRTMCSAW